MKKIIKWLALLILILAGAFVYNGITNIGSMVPTVAAVMPPPEKIEVSRQAMLRALEGKLELTTASMRLEKFVPGGVCDGNTWQNFAYEDCVTMLVPAKINAGFDWGTFKPEQIKSTSERITVDIGTPKIFDVVIDHQNIKVIYRSDGAFVSPDKSLEMRVLAATEPAQPHSSPAKAELCWCIQSACKLLVPSTILLVWLRVTLLLGRK